jgi:serine/threonine protein phosphatase 1
MIDRMLKTFLAPRPKPAIPAGRRVYAIGDVHGRLDLLDTLLDAIEKDDAARPPAAVTLVLLGDLIDRGPDSRAVVDRVRRGVSWAETVAVMGNHEAVMLHALAGECDTLENWLRFGGQATLAAWGVDPLLIAEGTLDQILDAARVAVPPADREWLAAMAPGIRIGDYYFVHAGIRPGIALDRQDGEDLLWIREPFLDSRRRHEAMVVHGHSICETVEMRSNRIGIDTGAYASGRLTALGLDGEDRWLLSTIAPALADGPPSG